MKKSTTSKSPKFSAVGLSGFFARFALPVSYVFLVFCLFFLWMALTCFLPVSYVYYSKYKREERTHLVET
jgi:hypothetical protein